MSGTSVAKWRDLYLKYNPMNANKPASIANIAFDTGVIAERQRILKWIEENTSEYGSKEEGLYVKKDHFDSTSLIAFIKGENE